MPSARRGAWRTPPPCGRCVGESGVDPAWIIEWYNHEHRHSGIAMLTPYDVHVGRADKVLRARQHAMDAAFARHPERFVGGPPRVVQLPSRAHINCPTTMAIRVVTADSEAVGVGA